MATRLAARELQDASKASMGKSSSGGLSSPVHDLSWYRYDRSVMRDILAGDSAYDPGSATMVRREDRAAGRADTTVAEILDFSETHSKMQSGR